MNANSTLCATVLACLLHPLLADHAAAEASRPNIVLVVIDDASFTDLGVYGSEIRTPHIDALAARGAQFTNFHAAPTCSPSRAMLMTGIDAHHTGIPTLDHLIPPEHRGAPGYEGELSQRVTTLAEHLGASGYATYVTGKWHLGQSSRSLPNARGFDRSFILDASGADNWEQRPYLPLYKQADWFADGERATLPDDFYSSQFLVDKMIEFIDETEGDRPFLAYVAFQAIHIPVQAPREFVERYDGVYDEGWAALRRARHAAAMARGLIPQNAPLGDVPDGLRAWEDLSESERRLSIMSMQVNAGMLEAMDHHFGRLIAHLDSRRVLDNTIFVVLSDNGPEHNDPTMRFGFDLWLMLQGYSRDPERLGERGTYAFIGPEWAAATASPSSLFKFHAAEGGVRVPLIMAGPGIVKSKPISAFTSIMDITPTLLDLASTPRLERGLPFSGRSLTPLLNNTATFVYGADEPVGMEATGQSALFKGTHKLVRNEAPYGDGSWRLYDLAVDPGETRDLSAIEPQRFAQMMDDYRAYASEYGVLELPEGYSAQDNIDAAAYRMLLSNYGPPFAFVAIVLGALWIAMRRRRAHRRRIA